MKIRGRSFRHWTPEYIASRVNEIVYRRSNPNHPWLTKAANDLLLTLLLPTDQGLEFGSGRSTTWLARQVGQLTSVEHDRNWYERVRLALRREGVAKKVQLVLCEDPALTDEPWSASKSQYVGVLDQFTDESLDFVLVDGIYRSDCAVLALPKVTAGGMLILDNANWFLPCDETHSPNSRRLSDGPSNARWSEFLDQVQGWRRIWTTSGVSDTAFFFKTAESERQSDADAHGLLSGRKFAG